MNQLCRTSDPVNSSAAANEIEADGTLGRMQRVALNLVRTNPGRTANELEKIGGFKDGQIRKRLKSLVDARVIYVGGSRPSSVTDKMNATYYPW